MKRVLIVFLIAGGFVSGGCEKIVQQFFPHKKQPEATLKPAIQRIENPELAKLILKPQRPKLDVSRDPFQPLVSSDQMLWVQGDGEYALGEWKFIGMVRMDDEFWAYLRSDTQKGTFKVNDKIKDYTIEEIQKDRVVFNNGEKTITLKRGMTK